MQVSIILSPSKRAKENKVCLFFSYSAISIEASQVAQ